MTWIQNPKLVKAQVSCTWRGSSRWSLLELFFIFLQNKCVPYWPDNQTSKEVGPYVVTCESEREAADYKVRVLEIAPVDRVTSQHRPLTSQVKLVIFHCFIFAFFWGVVSLFLPPRHSPNILVPSGTISTWAGLTMVSPRSQAASSASSLKSTLNRLNIPTLGPWSSTAGTRPLKTKGLVALCRYLLCQRYCLEFLRAWLHI